MLAGVAEAGGAHGGAGDGWDGHCREHVCDPRGPSGSSWPTARTSGVVLCVEFDPSGGPQLAVGSAGRPAAVYDVRALGRLRSTADQLRKKSFIIVLTER